jgi:uncharacterized protein YjiS (DUF1127 family)
MPTQLASRANLYASSAFHRHIAAQCLAIVEEVRVRIAIRHSLGNISDRQLQDAGLIRHDLEAACARGMSHSAASDLEAAARRRAGKW